MERELETACRLALAAGEVLREYLRRGVTVEHKTGPEDPVTEADRAASRLILDGLAAAFPEDGLLSEEELGAQTTHADRPRVWIVDPLDGTRNYVGGEPGYAVSIGLCVQGEPVLGAVYAPATDELFAGTAAGG
ncbi:3'(2'),5'-bisphosphate nucleotidase CysQ [Deinococcus lacus]|uniref:3'(2'),5'-bisphosphate nucleotidase CysQ n=1 Tax=Deinococcus lacus TaxID=392561 RepID=A0ABW1Y958_9DEIO